MKINKIETELYLWFYKVDLMCLFRPFYIYNYVRERPASRERGRERKRKIPSSLKLHRIFPRQYNRRNIAILKTSKMCSLSNTTLQHRCFILVRE